MFLSNNEHRFRVKIKGEKTGEWFEGDFTSKCILNNEEQVQIAILVDRYNAGSRTISQNHALINRAVAELEMRIVRDKKGKLLAPTWWVESDHGRLLYDTNVLYEVFTKAVEGEKIWAKRISGEADEAEKNVDEHGTEAAVENDAKASSKKEKDGRKDEGLVQASESR